jgi:hypothetical protein
MHAASGQTLNVTSGKDNSLTGLGNDRPDQVMSNVYATSPNCSSQAICVQFLNPAAFVQNPIGTYGNVGRNALRGPGMFSFDTSLVRTFKIRERFGLEARFEAFNILNHTNFVGAFAPAGQPAGASFGTARTNLSSSNFGQITGAYDPRILQFAMKLHSQVETRRGGFGRSRPTVHGRYTVTVFAATKSEFRIEGSEPRTPRICSMCSGVSCAAFLRIRMSRARDVPRWESRANAASAFGTSVCGKPQYSKTALSASVGSASSVSYRKPNIGRLPESASYRWMREAQCRASNSAGRNGASGSAMRAGGSGNPNALT